MNINKAHWVYAHRLLQCLTVASRPLCLEELAEVLAFDFDGAPEGMPKLNADWRREDQEQAVLSTCSSLITIVHNGRSWVVQFAHFSVKEFLMSDRLAVAIGDIPFHHIRLEPAHTILAQACLGVLLRLDDDTSESSVQRFPLADYAARHWVDHAQFENASLRLNGGIDDLFDVDKPHLLRWIRIHDIGMEWYWTKDETYLVCREAVPVYYAALCGFCGVVGNLISKHSEHVNARGGLFGTALHAASRGNHVEVAQSLLEHGAEINARRWKGWTPLHVASRFGQLEMGRWLLEHGADMNARKDNQWTPLHLAATNGCLELVGTLLGRDADVTAQGNGGETALHGTSANGHVNIARLLLDHGADPNARDKCRSTPLHMASHSGKLEVIHLLLERGGDAHAEDFWGRTAYEIALSMGHTEIIQLLSRKGIGSDA